MLTVVGGTYLEFCREPCWMQLFGSGGRAASALQRLSEGVELYSYIGSQDRPDLAALAATFSFGVRPTLIPRTIEFRYTHGLSTPAIRPPPQEIEPAQALRVEADRVLRFGMMEGDAEVHGVWVVYDPQSPSNPRPFAENGSTAEHLAIVANRREIALLTEAISHVPGSDSVIAQANVLVEQAGAEVVIVKQGTAGATIVTPNGTHVVPPVRTGRVWPIGSGDVFAAAFAHFWAEAGESPVDAAARAAACVAAYCASRSLPLDPSVANSAPLVSVAKAGELADVMTEPGQIYLAGPFFTIAERWLINEARTALLGEGATVFSPFHDVGYGAAADVVPADIRGIEASKAVLAIVDGLDAGTIFEVGYARAREIPVVIFAQNTADNDLKMMAGTGCTIVDDLASAVYQVIWATRSL